MKISIVIPSLNEESVIERALRSARSQKTGHEIELIVGDGYSSDNTVKIAKKYADRVVLEKKRSAAWQRQAGAKAARGDIILFTDADSQMPSGWAQKFAGEFEKNPDLAVVYSNVFFYDMNPLESWFSKASMDIYLSISAFFGVHNVVGSNFAVRTKFYRKAKGFDTRLVTCEDLDLAKRLSKFGGIKFISNNPIKASPRRLRKWGYLKFFLFHMSNCLNFHMHASPHKDYEPVR